MALGHWAVEYLGEGNGQGGSGGGGSGGGGGAMVVHTVYDAGITSLDKTWQEIYDALASGTPCIIVYENAEDEIANQAYLTKAELYDEGVYNVYTMDEMTTYKATSPSGYPAVGES